MKRITRLLLAAAFALSLSTLAFGQALMDRQDTVVLEKIRQARYVAKSPKVQSLGILHYSDIHGDDFFKILSDNLSSPLSEK